MTFYNSKKNTSIKKFIIASSALTSLLLTSKEVGARDTAPHAHVHALYHPYFYFNPIEKAETDGRAVLVPLTLTEKNNRNAVGRGVGPLAFVDAPLEATLSNAGDWNGGMAPAVDEDIRVTYNGNLILDVPGFSLGDIDLNGHNQSIIINDDINLGDISNGNSVIRFNINPAYDIDGKGNPILGGLRKGIMAVSTDANDWSGVESIDLISGVELTFNGDIEIDAYIRGPQTQLGTKGGKLILDADVVFKKEIDGAQILQVNDGHSATIESNISGAAVGTNGLVNLHNKGTLIINANKRNIKIINDINNDETDIEGYTADDEGIIEIKGDNKYKVSLEGALGQADNRLSKIIIAGSDTTFHNKTYVKNIEIDQVDVKFNNHLIMTNAGADRGSITFVANKGLNSGKVIFANNINFDGSIKTRFNNSGTVEYEGRSKVDYQIGELGRRLHTIYAGKGDIIFNNAVHTKQLILYGGSQVTYNHKTLKTDKVLLQHANAHIHFTKGLTQAVKIEAQNNNWGKVEFTGGGEVGEIGAAAHAVNELIFNAGGYNLNSNITTNGLTLNGNPTFTVRAPIVVKDAGKTYKLAANAVAATVNNLPLVGGGTVGAPLILATPLQNQLFTDIGGRLLAPGGAGGDAAGIKAIAATLAGYNALDYDAAILLARPAAGAAALVGNVAQLNAQITHIALHNRAVNLYNARTNAEVLRAAYNAGHGNAHHGGVAVAGAPGYNSAVRTAARNATVAAIGGINKARIKALSRLDAAAVARLSEAEVREYNTVMAEYNRQLPIALAAAGHRPAPHVPAPGNPAPGNPAPAPQEPAARTVTSAVIDNAGRLAMVSVAAPTAVHAAAIESTSRSTVAIVNSDNKTGVREEFAFAAAKKTGLSEEKIKKVVDRTPEQIAALSKEEVKEHKEVAEAISASGTLEAIIKKAEKEAVKTEVRTEAWKELGVDRKDVADAAPAQHVQFVAKLEQAPKMEGKVASIAQDAIADPTKVENLEKAALSLKKITRSESLDKLSEAAKDDAAVASASNAVKSLLYSASMSKNYSSSEERKAAIDKTVAQATETAASVSSHVSSAVSNIVSRIDALSFSNVAQLADSGLGASAGDDSVFAKAGVWVSGIYGQSKQGSVNSKSGYKGNLYGGSAGADLELGESIVLGGAYSNVSSDFKYSGGNKIGDKTDVKSHVFSIYAQTSFSQDIAWNNIVSLSRSNVEGKRNAEGKSVASGKSKSEGLSFETNLGYKIVQDDIMLVPSIGLRYGYFKDKGYTETGAGVHNITQSASSSKILTGILGAKVMWNTKVGDASFSPYLQGSIDHNFSHKGGNVNAKYTWMENYFASKAETENKPEKTAYNVGVGALMKQNNVELTLGYNLNLAKKYQSHQGTVKLKVSF